MCNFCSTDEHDEHAPFRPMMKFIFSAAPEAERAAGCGAIFLQAALLYIEMLA
jgi:hypothetical protein